MRFMHCLYRHFSKSGKLLYVGCSLNPVARLFIHRYHSHWFKDLHKIEIEHIGDKETALKSERLAIIKENPLYNHNKRFPEKVHDAVKYLQYLKRCESRNNELIALRKKGWTLERIAKKFKVSRQRVHQILSGRG